jgi:hypothetical protein
MEKAILNYWDCLRKTKQYKNGGGYYQDQTSEIIRQEEIEGSTDIEVFEKFYKLNNSLRYCNGSYYKWVDAEWEIKYRVWLKSDDYKQKSFNLYYDGGVVD